MARPPLTTRRRKKISAGARSKSVPEEVSAAQLLAIVRNLPVSSAYREYERELVNACRSEYQQQLLRAAAFLPTTKPRTQEDRRALADLIKGLQKQLRGAPVGGSRHSSLEISLSELILTLPPAANRAAAHLVRMRKQTWLKTNDRKRVPPSVTTELISEAIKQISSQWKLPSPKISADEVRRLLNKK